MAPKQHGGFPSALELHDAFIVGKLRPHLGRIGSQLAAADVRLGFELGKAGMRAGAKVVAFIIFPGFSDGVTLSGDFCDGQLFESLLDRGPVIPNKAPDFDVWDKPTITQVNQVP